jgi:hypothetical protein
MSDQPTWSTVTVQIREKESDPLLCPTCYAGEHWNHQKPGQAQPSRGPLPIEVGECRTYDTISGQRCGCLYREEAPS